MFIFHVSGFFTATAAGYRDFFISISLFTGYLGIYDISNIRRLDEIILLEKNDRPNVRLFR